MNLKWTEYPSKRGRYADIKITENVRVHISEMYGNGFQSCGGKKRYTTEQEAVADALVKAKARAKLLVKEAALAIAQIDKEAALLKEEVTAK